jgi:hypothetical protein
MNNSIMLMNDNNGNNFNELLKWSEENNEQGNLHHEIMLKEFDKAKSLFAVRSNMLMAKIERTKEITNAEVEKNANIMNENIQSTAKTIVESIKDGTRNNIRMLTTLDGKLSDFKGFTDDHAKRLK